MAQNSRKGVIGTVTLLTVIAAAGWGMTAFFYNKQLMLSEGEAVHAEELQKAADEASELQLTIDELKAQLKTQEAILASREGFISIVDEAATVLREGSGKVDLSQLQKKLVELQEVVFEERLNTATIAEAGEELSAVIEETRGRLEQFNELRAAENEALSEKRKTVPNWLVGARSALDKAGGSWVALGSEPQVCSKPEAIACATQGRIVVREDLASHDEAYWIGPMTHEYAHQIQFKQWEKLLKNPTQIALFGEGEEGMERLADCMASFRLPSYVGPYAGTCTSEQLTYAEKVWG